MSHRERLSDGGGARLAGIQVKELFSLGAARSQKRSLPSSGGGVSVALKSSPPFNRSASDYFPLALCEKTQKTDES